MGMNTATGPLCPDSDRMVAFARGDTLPGDEADRIGAHLDAGCENCEAIFDRHRAPDHAADDKEPKPVIPGYVIGEMLGRGGMGAVFEAVRVIDGTRVAIKLPRVRSASDPLTLFRFRREIKLATAIRHPNVVRVIESGETADGRPCLMMEFLTGKSLVKLVEDDGPLAPDDARRCLCQAADALMALRAANVVHRDITPSNFMLCGPTLKLIDLGLAKGSDEVKSASPLTGSGFGLGTPTCVAPEQLLDAQRAGHQADVYGLGCTGYFLLTGVFPYKSSLGFFDLGRRFRPPPLVHRVNDKVPADVSRVIARMMARNLWRRYWTASRAAAALRRCGRRGSFPGWTAVAVAVLAAVAVAIGLLAGPTLPRPRREGILPGPRVPIKPTPPTAGPPVTPGARGLPAPIELTNDLGIALQLIPGGDFEMGVDDQGPEFADQRPPHRVTVPRPFYLGKFEVTRGQFEQFVAASQYRTDAERPKAGGVGYDLDPRSAEWWRRSPTFNWRNPGFPQGPDHPVVNVSRNDAERFCEWLSGREGRLYRLPTEAEWERAARAGGSGRYPFGSDEVLIGRANLADRTLADKLRSDAAAKLPTKCLPDPDGFPFTAPVGRLQPNGYGLFDMYGNVREWCRPMTGTDPVARGGSFWDHWIPYVLSRHPHQADFCTYDAGFRVCAEVAD